MYVCMYETIETKEIQECSQLDIKKFSTKLQKCYKPKML